MEKKNKNIYYSIFALICISIIIGIVVISQKPKYDKPVVTIDGDPEWFNNSKHEDSNYIIKKFKIDTMITNLEWPPKELSRTVDISFDISKSVFVKQINNNPPISLAEYNLVLLNDYLKENLKAGDKVNCRTIGVMYNKSQREVKDFLIQPYLVNVKILKATKGGAENVIFKVKSYDDRKTQRDSTIENVVKYFKSIVDTTKNNYNDQRDCTPTFNHFDYVLSRYSFTASKEMLFLFVTDGWFQTGSKCDGILFDLVGFNANPDIFESVKKSSDIPNRPFLKIDTVIAHKIKIELIGLNKSNNHQFGESMIEIFQWFFEPIKIKTIFY
jgi:hypothetical protein